MKRTVKFFGVIAALAVFGFSAITAYAQSEAAFEGTWRMGTYELVIDNNCEYVYKERGVNSTMGHITFTSNQLTLNDTSEWNGTQWVSTSTVSETFRYTLSGKTLVLKNNKAWAFLNGTWTASTKSAFQGSWSMGTYELMVDDNCRYIYKEKGVNSTMGYITFTSNQFILNDIFSWNGSQWVPTSITSGTFRYTLSGNSLVLRNNTLWPFLNGTWTLR
ncbi:MAG: hypothetical protein FWB73_07510 [Treponema sp.]|nr:hypothetical protein [Treponema sp.]